MKSYVAMILLFLAAALHVAFMVLEMFPADWPWMFRLQSLGLSPDEQIKAAPILRNAGLYNGFIAAGLIWGTVLFKKRRPGYEAIATFFLSCVIIAGLFGAWSLGSWIVLIAQSGVGCAALIAVLRTRRI